MICAGGQTVVGLRPERVIRPGHPVKTQCVVPSLSTALYSGMSRRKQRRPQQLISDCEGPSASENGGCWGREWGWGLGGIESKPAWSRPGQWRAPRPRAKPEQNLVTGVVRDCRPQAVGRRAVAGRHPLGICLCFPCFSLDKMEFSNWLCLPKSFLSKSFFAHWSLCRC